ncbi:MAG: hypothetical protein IBJ18_02365 [Phycisphaerales bacterium]|nr:hypothetical protein [Phycisphaerales bacterium]
MIISFFGSLLLCGFGLSVLALGLSCGWYFKRPPSGADAMGLALVFFVGIAGWVCALLAGVIGALRGGMAWVHGSIGLAMLIAAVVIIGLGVLGMACWAYWADRGAKWVPMVANFGATVVPGVLMVVVLSALWRESGSIEHAAGLRGVGAVLALFGGVGFAAAVYHGFRYMHRTLENERLTVERDREMQQRFDREQREFHEKAAKELEALPDDSPLAAFFDHTSIVRSDAHRVRAYERISALPGLTRRLEEVLSDTDPWKRIYATGFISESPKPDHAWVEGLVISCRRLIENIEAAPEMYDQPTQLSLGGMMQSQLMAAQRFDSPRLKELAPALRKAIEAKPDTPRRAKALEVLGAYERGETIVFKEPI